MKLYCEKLPETTATPKLIEELFRNDKRRGDWIVLDDDSVENSFVQTAKDGDGFSFEWRDGSDAALRCASRLLSRDEAKSAFLAFLGGDTSWTANYDWTDVSFETDD